MTDMTQKSSAQLGPGGHWRNWVGNQSFIARHKAEPGSEDELAALVHAAAQQDIPVRVAGSGHSFTPVVATSGLLLSLKNMQGLVRVDLDRKRVVEQNEDLRLVRIRHRRPDEAGESSLWHHAEVELGAANHDRGHILGRTRTGYGKRESEVTPGPIPRIRSSQVGIGEEKIGIEVFTKSLGQNRTHAVILPGKLFRAERSVRPGTPARRPRSGKRLAVASCGSDDSDGCSRGAVRRRSRGYRPARALRYAT